MAVTSLPPQERLRKLLDYTPETGLLIWRAKSPDDFADGRRSRETYAKIWNSSVAGKLALSAKKANGYLCGSVDSLQVLQHRVIWKWMTGQDPDHIDHINGNPSDNRWCNSRSVTRHLNMRNMKRSKVNSSGKTGVEKVKNKWIAKGSYGKKTVFLGTFETKEDAVKRRVQWERENNYHANHGQIR